MRLNGTLTGTELVYMFVRDTVDLCMENADTQLGPRPSMIVETVKLAVMCISALQVDVQP